MAFPQWIAKHMSTLMPPLQMSRRGIAARRTAGALMGYRAAALGIAFALGAALLLRHYHSIEPGILRGQPQDVPTEEPVVEAKQLPSPLIHRIDAKLAALVSNS